MDAIVDKTKSSEISLGKGPDIERPSEEEAKEAVRTLLRWAGDDPTREGLVDTPKRVVNAYREFFSGYETCPLDVLSRTFEEVGGYDDIVLLKDIEFHSHCEHHMVPIIGKAHVAYLPTDKVVGISKLARVVDIYAKRLQTQETMTAQVAQSIDKQLKPRGVAVFMDAVHQCMSKRGVRKRNVATVTMQFTGEFQDDPALQARFMELIRTPTGTYSL